LNKSPVGPLNEGGTRRQKRPNYEQKKIQIPSLGSPPGARIAMKYKVSKGLSLVLPAGALGASLLLSTSSAQATDAPDRSKDVDARPGVAARLEAIRAGVAEMATPATEGTAEPEAVEGAGAAPTWWGNGGWGRWHPGWGNGGWRFGWHNGGGWGNGGWPNGWHNWGNGWNNWGNGWHNYWHNG
jgi:rSAM-associated Gly-rich repeat protein